MAQHTVEIELMERELQSEHTNTESGLSEDENPLATDVYTHVGAWETGALHNEAQTIAAKSHNPSTKLPAPALVGLVLALGQDLSDDLKACILNKDADTNKLVAIIDGCDTHPSRSQSKPDASTVVGITYTSATRKLDDDGPFGGLGPRQPTITAVRRAQTLPSTPPSRAFTPSSRNPSSTQPRLPAGQRRTQQDGTSFNAGAVSTQAIQPDTDDSASFDRASIGSTAPTTITRSTSAAGHSEVGGIGTRLRAKLPAINDNAAEASPPFRPLVLSRQVPALVVVERPRFINCGPAILLLCLILSVACAVFQTASSSTYFSNSPVAHDGHFNDPDYLSLVATFCAQSLGIFVALFGILGAGDPHVAGWSMIIGVASFVCSSVALGIYFLHTNLGDLLMTIAALFQFWIWMIIAFELRATLVAAV